MAAKAAAPFNLGDFDMLGAPAAAASSSSSSLSVTAAVAKTTASPPLPRASLSGPAKTTASPPLQRASLAARRPPPPYTDPFQTGFGSTAGVRRPLPCQRTAVPDRRAVGGPRWWAGRDGGRVGKGDSWEPGFANAFSSSTTSAAPGARPAPPLEAASPSLGAFASLTSVSPEKLQAALAQLVDLGLDDEARNRDALARYDYDVNRAAAYLTSFL